jgi:hypothetical protein
MTSSDKQLSNPISTGGAGPRFESHVQASFVALMLTGGYAPCLPCWPIIKIKLQGMHAGYATDDLIVFVQGSDKTDQRKLLCQIKLKISITEKDIYFRKVIQSAWKDFNNSKVFTKGKDAFALITGPISATDVNDVRRILEWTRDFESSEEFNKNVQQANFSSSNKRYKLKAFKTNLKHANDGKDVSDDNVYEFLKHFHLLGYDLDIKAGVMLSLFHSLIAQYSPDDVPFIWTRIVDEVQSANMNAGTLTLEKLPKDLRDKFKQRVIKSIPDEFAIPEQPVKLMEWNSSPYATDLAQINLIGACNEQNKADCEIISMITRKDFSSWITKLQEIIQESNSPISLRNGLWKINERKILWDMLGSRVFDNDLEIIKECAVRVLKERDPQFELLPEERYLSNIYGKVFKYSQELRKGIAETLALLGCKPSVLTNCSQHKAELISDLTVREILSDADFILWGSLNRLLPVLAEASPNEFLNAVEHALQQKPCPFIELFTQEEFGIMGRTYIAGLLWALEALAWDEEFLVRVSVILGELAILDPGGNWANRPINSLTTILLPWYPQTTASIEKRYVAVKTLRKEFPDVAWKLLLTLLPNQHSSSSGTYKPKWRDSILPDWNKHTIKAKYFKQVENYSDIAVEMACEDMKRLDELVCKLANLPQPFFEKLLVYLSSSALTDIPEEQRLTIWNNLTGLVTKHRRYSDAEWALPSEIVDRIENVVKLLTPENPLNLHCRLFSDRDFELYNGKGDWEEQVKTLNNQRKQAIEDIFEYGGIDAVLKFMKSVDSPSNVGQFLGEIAGSEIDQFLLPDFLVSEDKAQQQFISSYVWCRNKLNGWKWIGELNRSEWSNNQNCQLLVYLPFTKNAWQRASEWLGNSEKEYWGKVNVYPIRADSDFRPAIDKLIEVNRGGAAIDCLYKMHRDKQDLDIGRTVKSLLNAISTEESFNALDSYQVIEMIKALQNDPNTDPDDLSQIEWKYLPILHHPYKATPKTLENRLASDPEFFCEVIRLVYCSEFEKEKGMDLDEQQKALATNAYDLLYKWKTPPGQSSSGEFSGGQLTQWLKHVKRLCAESGHYDIAMDHVGRILFYTPPDPQGLWINKFAAEALNARDAEIMRDAYYCKVRNSRGVYCGEPTGKSERELSKYYRKKAEDLENAGYHCFVVTLRKVSKVYECEAERIVAEHKEENEADR